MRGVSAFPRTLNITPSGRILLPIAAIHLLTAIGFLLAISLLLASGAIVLLAISFLCVLWGHCQRQGEHLRLEDDGTLTVFRGSLEVAGRVVGSPTDAGWAVWVIWQEEGAWMSHARMLLRADFTQEDWRALGLWLRHRAAVAGRGEERFSDAA